MVALYSRHMHSPYIDTKVKCTQFPLAFFTERGEIPSLHLKDRVSWISFEESEKRFRLWQWECLPNLIGLFLIKPACNSFSRNGTRSGVRLLDII